MANKIRIAFDETHEELLKIGTKDEHEWESWTNAKDLIEKKGWEIIILEDAPFESFEFSQFNILVIGAPQTVFSEEQITTIVGFVKNGGSLLVLNEYGGDIQNNTNLSEVTKHFGIIFNNDMVYDKIHNIKGHSYGPIITNFEQSSSLTFDLREFNLLLGCSLVVNNKAHIIAKSGEDAYVKNLTPNKKWVKKQLPSMPVLAEYHKPNEKGRVVAIGNSHLFSDDDAGMPFYHNKILFNNILEWLCEPSLNANEKFTLLTEKINKMADDVTILKKKIGIIETGPSIYEREAVLPDEVVGRVDRLEALLRRVETVKEKEELKYYKQRVNLQIWGTIVSAISIITVVLVALFTK